MSGEASSTVGKGESLAVSAEILCAVKEAALACQVKRCHRGL